MKTMIKPFSLLSGSLAIALLSGCGGGSGQEVQSSDAVDFTPPDSTVVYTGPIAAQNEDVALFQEVVWNNLASESRCGACHQEEAGQAPMFVRGDDINAAYSTMFDAGLVDPVTPSESLIVQKVASGHNCWGDQVSVCADILQGYIENWLGGSADDGEENVVVLVAPEEKEVGTSLKFSTESTEFSDTLWPLLRGESGCSDCHSEDGSRSRQQPYFASANVDTAYAAAQTKINLNTPAESRLVERLRAEGHNCWEDPAGGNSCVYSANTMQAAIQAYIAQLDEPQGLAEDLEAVASRAVNLTADGVVASSGGRFETNIVALYEFKFGSGGIAYDYSGVEPALNLNIQGDVSWVGSWGLRFAGGSASGNTTASKKLSDAIKRTGEFSVETWVIPANVSQDGPARIVTYSGGVDERNFTLGQTLYDYDFMSRSSEIDQDDFLSTPSDQEILQATLQHVVVNYDPINGRFIYVNGELVASDETPGGNLNDWDNIYALSIGGEVGSLESWDGTIRLLAIHDRVLNEEQIARNFEAGVGQKFFLMFGVSHLVDMPEAYVVFEVEVFDDYSYLFDAPFFISLDREATPPPGGINLSGMHIGMNGVEVPIGQAYTNLEMVINQENYNPNNGASLSSVGTVIASELGQDIDEFFLTFDQIGDNSYARTEADVAIPEEPALADQQSDVGMKNFGEINASLSAMTTVPATNSAVSAVYANVVQQLPQIEDIEAFLPAHQAGIMQLAVAYCTQLVETNSLRSAYFPDFNFSGGVNADNVENVVNPLLQKIGAYPVDLGDDGTAELSTQPGVDSDGSRDLVSDLVLSVSSSGSERAVIAGCTAVAGSAVMLMQ